jgi:hypothetical protein
VLGVSYDVFWHLNPTKLKPFQEAYRIKQENRDAEMWTFCGNYVLSAVITAVDACLNGRKASSKYIEKPLLKDRIDERKEMTEEELQRQRELFVAKLLVMKTNFELNKSKNEN